MGLDVKEAKFWGWTRRTFTARITPVMVYINRVIEGDCEKVLKKIPDKSVDFIFTSPPYAQQRLLSYGGISPDKYVEWFLPKAAEFYRVLKPKGTFILNIKEPVVRGQRHTFVIDLISGLKEQGWLWTEEFIWHKKNSFPGKWPNRFRDSWERVLQFNKEKRFKMQQDSVKVRIGEWAKNRLQNLSKIDKTRDMSKVGSGFGKNVSNWVGKRKVYPTNVIQIATVSANKNHSAVFPEELPTWFIRLFTNKNDIVLDPFLGSGTTAVAAKKLDRKYLGIEINEEYCDYARARLKAVRLNGKDS